MNTLLSYLPALLWFFPSLLLTSLIGFACYCVVHWIEDVFSELLIFLEIIVTLLTLYLTLGTFPDSLILLVITVAICAVGTFAEQAVLPLEPKWGMGFLRLFLTTVCSLVLCLTLILTLQSLNLRGKYPKSDAGMFGLVWGLALGAFCSPSVIPVFIWLWRSSQMRPGIDKHRETHEKP